MRTFKVILIMVKMVMVML